MSDTEQDGAAVGDAAGEAGRLGAEDDGADGRVQAIGADDGVRLGAGAVGEGEGDTAPLLLEAGELLTLGEQRLGDREPVAARVLDRDQPRPRQRVDPAAQLRQPACAGGNLNRLE